ncbi:MAG TPA: hypothetical protein VNE58_17995 [Casimicrobiaceae bacterium]|nr:hypothetical protein [Casimicrobiaceae bacterium]
MCSLIVAVALAGSSHAATSTGDGEFVSRGFTMPVASALAFRGKSTLDGKDAIIVAISNGDFRSDWFANYVDRRRAVEQRMKDRETAVVYLEFAPDATYRGLTYYFKQGNNCGYCGLGVASTVKLVGNRIVGTLKMKDDARTMNVKLDVPILSDDYGQPLPADGGAPGRAYLAYHDALVKRDVRALLAVMSAESSEGLEKAARKGKPEAELEFLAKDHPSKSVRITKGYARGNNAVLLIAGETEIMRLVGEVTLVNEGGRWRVDDELTSVVLK